jgi:hypothetical protein
MPAHEAKGCPRCHQPFECKAGSITQCNCTQIHLSEEEKAFIADRYEDCLCLSCLKDLKNKYLFFKEKYFGA